MISGYFGFVKGKLQSRSPHSSGKMVAKSDHVLKLCYTHKNVVLHLLDPPFLFGDPSLTLIFTSIIISTLIPDQITTKVCMAAIPLSYFTVVID